MISVTRFASALMALLLVVCGTSAWAREPSLAVPANIDHTSYTSRQGAPNGVSSLAQTEDGLMWVGTGDGLYVFDGASFQPFQIHGQAPLQTLNVTSVDVSPTGDVWVGTLLGEIYRVRGDIVEHFGRTEGVPYATIFSIAGDRSGHVFAGTTRGVYALAGGRWSAVTNESGDSIGTVCAPLLVEPSGRLTVMNHEGRAFEMAPQAHRLSARGSASEYCGIVRRDPQGARWNLARETIYPFGEAARRSPSTKWRYRMDLGAIWDFIDSRGAIWGITTNGQIIRMSCFECVRSRGYVLESDVERIATPDQLSGATRGVWMEDREGNVWMATTGGLESFRSTTFRRTPTPNGALFALTLATSQAGDLLTGGGLGLYSGGFNGGLHRSPGFPDVPISSVYRARDGSIWAGASAERNLLLHSTSRGIQTLDLPGQSHRNTVWSVAEADDGEIWVSAFRDGVFSWNGRRWAANGGIAGLPNVYATIMSSGADHRLWLGYRDGRVAMVKQGRARLFSSADRLDVGGILAFTDSEYGLWVGGSAGVALLRPDNNVLQLRATDEKALRGVSGIALTNEGDLWLNGAAGAVRIAHADLARFLSDPAHPVPPEIFGMRGGVSGVASTARPLQTAALTADGRIWVSTPNGLFSADSNNIRRNEIPPVPLVMSVTADSHRSDRPARLKLPPLTRSLEIDYTASSLSAPELVRFRYKLEQVDSDWREAGERRQAFYTNLPPGSYSFKVMAANEDGVWSVAPATLVFEISPAFWQTRWFLAACILLACLIFGLGVRWRVRAATRAVQQRADERADERERIARELHDTLFQDMQGLVFGFQAAVGRLDAADSTRTEVERLLNSADRMLGDARDRVEGLRSTRSIDDLSAALNEAGNVLASTSTARFEFSSDVRAASPTGVVASEIYFAVREGLINAFRHAAASAIALEVSIDKHRVLFTIRDDGKGMDERLIAHAPPGHWGLKGMRERIERIGGRLTIRSSQDGTVVIVDIPASPRVKLRLLSALTMPS